MGSRVISVFDAVRNALSNRIVVAVLATVALIYMYWQAHANGVWLAHANGFGSDFHGTVWAPDRAVLHGISPYPSGSQTFAIEPAVYLPPIFLVTLPFGWLSLHVAIWVWFGVLMASAFGVLAVLGARDPRCYAFLIMSLPVVQALVLGNASILIALGAALGWRFRKHPILGPVAIAATVAVKFWLWPLFVWLLIIRPRAGLRAVLAFAAINLGAWTAIGFHGLRGYPALMHTEGRLFAREGVLFVAALIQLNVAIKLAVAIGFLGGLILLGAAWVYRASEIKAFSLALLAALVATPVAWPHYLILMALPLVIVWPRLTLAWAWFPALWLAEHIGEAHGQIGQSLALCLFAVLPVVIVAGFPPRSIPIPHAVAPSVIAGAEH